MSDGVEPMTGRISREIVEQARQLRERGSVPSDVVQRVDDAFAELVPTVTHRQPGERLRAVIQQAERLSFIDMQVSTASNKPFVAPVKKGVRTAVQWYVGAIIGQMQEYLRADLHALRVACDAIASLEHRMSALESRIADLEGRLEAPSENRLT